MIGQFLKTASGRTSYEIYEAEGDMVFEVIQILKDRFGFSTRLPVFWLDEIYIDLKKENLRLTVGWDEWSGCFVMANSSDSDAVVREIGVYLESVLSDIEM